MEATSLGYDALVTLNLATRALVELRCGLPPYEVIESTTDCSCVQALLPDNSRAADLQLTT